jgi:hypothetical protein
VLFARVLALFFLLRYLLTMLEDQGFPIPGTSRSAEGGSPLPVREVTATAAQVSSLLPPFPAAAGGKLENWKALARGRIGDDDNLSGRVLPALCSFD